jgi:nematocidal protein AidA
MNTVLSNTDALIVIDTISLQLSGIAPSSDQASPSPIDLSLWHVILPGRPETSPELDAAFSMRISKGSTLTLRCVSATCNYDAATILYGVAGHTMPHGLYTTKVVTSSLTMAVQPDPDQLNGLPPLQAPQNFTALKMNFLAIGITRFYLEVAVYDTAGNGEDQELYGYYKLPMTVLVG